ncbi:MAG TPA: multiubiquitin domain-containing protein, partial [Oculatellaceae cyanobacterium]
MKTTTEYRIRIDEQQFTVTDPVITGRQLLEKANKLSAEEHLIFQLLHDGQLEEIRLDETVDLRQAGIEKFITWRSDRTFYLVIDGRRFPWGAPIITGRQLKKLAGVDPATYSVW